MSEVDQDQLAGWIKQLEQWIPRDGAAVKLEGTLEQPDAITANPRGFLRLGIELLKAGYRRPEDPADPPSPVGEMDLSYLFQADSPSPMPPCAPLAFSEVDHDRLVQLVHQLDQLISRDGAMVKLEKTPEQGHAVTANRPGFLRLGVEMLKAGSRRPEDPPAEVDLSYLFPGPSPTHPLPEAAASATADPAPGRQPPSPLAAAEEPQSNAATIVLLVVGAIVAALGALIYYAVK